MRLHCNESLRSNPRNSIRSGSTYSLKVQPALGESRLYSTLLVSGGGYFGQMCGIKDQNAQWVLWVLRGFCVFKIVYPNPSLIIN